MRMRRVFKPWESGAFLLECQFLAAKWNTIEKVSLFSDTISRKVPALADRAAVVTVTPVDTEPRDVQSVGFLLLFMVTYVRDYTN